MSMCNKASAVALYASVHTVQDRIRIVKLGVAVKIQSLLGGNVELSNVKSCL